MGNCTFLGFNFICGLILTILAWALVYNLTGLNIDEHIKVIAAVLAGGRTFLTIIGLFAWIWQVNDLDNN